MGVYSLQGNGSSCVKVQDNLCWRWQRVTEMMEVTKTIQVFVPLVMAAASTTKA